MPPCSLLRALLRHPGVLQVEREPHAVHLGYVGYIPFKPQGRAGCRAPGPRGTGAWALRWTRAPGRACTAAATRWVQVILRAVILRAGIPARTFQVCGPAPHARNRGVGGWRRGWGLPPRASGNARPRGPGRPRACAPPGTPHASADSPSAGRIHCCPAVPLCFFTRKLLPKAESQEMWARNSLCREARGVWAPEQFVPRVQGVWARKSLCEEPGPGTVCAFCATAAQPFQCASTPGRFDFDPHLRQAAPGRLPNATNSSSHRADRCRGMHSLLGCMSRHRSSNL
jgi:hypothetical protein